MMLSPSGNNNEQQIQIDDPINDEDLTINK